VRVSVQCRRDLFAHDSADRIEERIKRISLSRSRAKASGKRTGAWLKYKVKPGSVVWVVGGHTPGNSFDALVVGYYESERFLYAAKREKRVCATDLPGGGN
jgi:hypothetical protein